MTDQAASSTASQRIEAQSSSSTLGSAARGQGSLEEERQRGWARRLSLSSRSNFPALPALPQLPNLPLGTPGLTTLQNLRSALLGYLGEVEESVRSMGEMSDAGTVDSDVTGSSAGLDEVDQDATGWSSGVASGKAGLRARKEASGSRSTDTTSGMSASTAAPDQRRNHEALLAHLSNLRADVQAYLPLPPLPSFRVPSMSYHTPGSATASAAVAQTQEWLRSLPGRLRAVERALPGTGDAKEGSLAKSRTLGDLMSSFPFPSYAYGAESQRDKEGSAGSSLGGARLRLLEIVRSALPSDEWEGWERLGWEETELHPDDRYGWETRPGFDRNPWASGSNGTRLTRSLSHPARMQIPSALDSDEDDEDSEEMAGMTGDEAETGDDEDTVAGGPSRSVQPAIRVRATSNFLFPNRTPAATEAIKRRRNVRSRSLGSAGHPGRWAALLGDEWSQGGDRIQTRPDGQASVLDRDDDEDNVLVEPIVGGKVASPVKLRPPPLSRNKSSIHIGNPGELGPSVAEALEMSEDGKVLISYEDLPVDWRNNEHVLTGYRFIPLHSSTGPIPLIKSAFAWHNETLNIHTHFIPTVFVLCFIPFLLYSTPLPDAHPLDTIVLALYLVAAVSCMFSSAMWHVLSGCASKKWFEWGACVDYIGISWLIAASFGTVVYNAFYCRPKLVYLYLGTNAACGALGSYLPFQRWFNMRRMKPWRIAFFLFLNFAMFAPLLQLFWLHGWAAARFCVAFVPSICAYVAGLLFYGFHFPECVWPGKFDTWGASHQIWHTGIVLAIILHYRAVFTAHDMRHDLTCAAPGAGVEVGRAVEAWVRGLWA